MNTLQQKSTAQNLGSEVHLARILLAKAESQLTTTKEQSRIARRRRKEAKQAARHAKKQARQAKEQVAEAKLALAEAEDKLAKTNRRPFKRKMQRKPAKQVAAAPTVTKATKEIVKGVKDDFGGNTQTETYAQPGVTESFTSPASDTATPKPIVTE